MQDVRRKKTRKKKTRCRHDNYDFLYTFLHSEFDCIMLDWHEYSSMKSCIESLRISIKRYKYGNLISLHQCEDRAYLCKGTMF